MHGMTVKKKIMILCILKKVDISHWCKAKKIMIIYFPHTHTHRSHDITGLDRIYMVLVLIL